MSGRDWELVARREPYWGVLSHDRYRSDRFDEVAAAEFWGSGEEHVAAVLATLRARVCPGFNPTVAVDFGCGVGPLLDPLARRAGRVVAWIRRRRCWRWPRKISPGGA